MTDPRGGESSPIETAELDWSAPGPPLARRFGDLYFSREDGLEESRHVFLEHNDLPARWANLAPDEDFIIGETGFGTGLNFLAAWQLWRKAANPQARLHMISVEAFPLGTEDMTYALERIGGAWPGLATLTNALREAYPTHRHPGLHHLVFDGGRVRLTLAFAEAAAGLAGFLPSEHPRHALPARAVDAWFLDGFAPKKNPDMWRPEVLQAVRQLSREGTTIATFTAAGHVRRGLEAAGFRMCKAPGFGDKRHMLSGVLTTAPARPPAEAFQDGPYPDDRPHAWHVASPVIRNKGPGAGKGAAVIGGGLAGCHAADALARRGIDVTLFEAGSRLASGGSGNRQGVLYAKPSPRGGLASTFNLTALLFAQRHYQRFWSTADERQGRACGVLHMAMSDEEDEAHAMLGAQLASPGFCRHVERAEAESLAGVPLTRGGLWFPGSGWLAPRAVCERLAGPAARAGDLAVRQARIMALERTRAGAWSLLDERGDVVCESRVVILACATVLSGFTPTRDLPVQPVRGQVSTLPAQGLAAGTGLRVALCADGYVTPLHDSGDGPRLCFGASFAPNVTETQVQAMDHRDNLSRLRRCFPGLVSEAVDENDCDGRAALRCATPDRLPMAGPVPDVESMTKHFALLRKNANAAIAAAGAWQEGLYVSAGYGSRGLAYIPLASEWLAAQITGEPPPLDRALRIALNPGRFLIRDLKRNRA